jgi:methionyl-tRNA formyltransferase
VPTLEALVDDGHDVVLVVSGPDRRRARRGEPTPSPVKAAALARGLGVGTDVREAVRLDAELGVVVAYGRLIPPDVLDRLAFVNLHLSLLPRWRGAAPVERAILAGDTESGVSIMALDVGLDTGGVYETITTPIGPNDDASSLGTRLVDLGTQALLKRLRRGIAGLGVATAQVGEVTYAEKLTAVDRTLDFGRSAEANSRVVRIGGATTTFRGAVFKVLRAEALPDGPVGVAPGILVGDVVATRSGGLRLIEVQAAGKRPQPFGAFANGARIEPDEMLGVPTAGGQGEG